MDDFVLDEWPAFMEVDHEEEVYTSESEPEPVDVECGPQEDEHDQASEDECPNPLVSESEHGPAPRPDDGSKPGSQPVSEHESEPEDDDREDEAAPAPIFVAPMEVRVEDAPQDLDAPMGEVAVVNDDAEERSMPVSSDPEDEPMSPNPEESRMSPDSEQHPMALQEEEVKWDPQESPMSPDPEESPMSRGSEEPPMDYDAQEQSAPWDPQESPMSPDPEPEYSDSSPTSWVFEASPFYDYLFDVAQTGRSSLPWEEVQPAFLEYFEEAIHTLEKCFRRFSYEAGDLSYGSENMRIHRFICEKIKSFDDFPFTFRRICELLVDPTRCYTKLPKFMRALEKVVNVVSTLPLYAHQQPAPKLEQEEPKLESLFFRSPNDEFDQLHVSDYGPDEDEETADTAKSNCDSDESHMCYSDSTCSTCEGRSTCDDSDATLRPGESQDDASRGGDAKARKERQKAGSDVEFARLKIDDGCREYDADTDDDAEERIRIHKRVKRRYERRKYCRKRLRNDDALMKEFAQCTISKRLITEDDDVSGVDTATSRLHGQDNGDVVMAEDPVPFNRGTSEFQQLLNEAGVTDGPENYEAYEVVTEEEIRREIAEGRVYEIYEVREMYDEELGQETFEVLEQHDELPELPLDCEHAHAFLDDEDEDMDESELDAGH